MPSPSVHLLNSDCAQSLQSYIICSVELSLITSGKITPKVLMYIIIVTLHKLFSMTCDTYFLVIPELLKGKPRIIYTDRPHLLKRKRQKLPIPENKEGAYYKSYKH